ncbi:MAG: hypothetical protein Fur0043_26030 [Anaerolineales bacterium]
MSPTHRQYSLAREALAELRPEIAAQRALLMPHVRHIPAPATPALEQVLAEIGALPREALFLGVAADGLPVLLNLHDATPGPLLLVADRGAGKTAFLQTIAHAAAILHPPEETQFGVLTARPEEWQGFAELPQCAGIFPVYHNTGMDFLYSLGGWAHANKSARQSVLLLLDDLTIMEHVDFDARQTLRWLLLRGPARRVWPIVTVNAEEGQQVRAWLDAFRTRLYGQIRQCPDEFEETEASTLFQSLKAGVQFALREGEGWLKFWIPT